MQYIGRFTRLFKREERFNPDDDILLMSHKKSLKHIPKYPPKIEAPSDLDVTIFGNPLYNVRIEARGATTPFVMAELTRLGYLGWHVVTDRFFMLPGTIPRIESRTAYIDVFDPFDMELGLQHLAEKYPETIETYRSLEKASDPRSDIVMPGFGVVSGHIHYEGGGIHYIRRNGRHKILIYSPLKPSSPSSSCK